MHIPINVYIHTITIPPKIYPPLSRPILYGKKICGDERKKNYEESEKWPTCLERYLVAKNRNLYQPF